MDFSDEQFADLDELLSQLDARIQERLAASCDYPGESGNVKQGT